MIFLITYLVIAIIVNICVIVSLRNAKSDIELWNEEVE